MAGVEEKAAKAAKMRVWRTSNLAHVRAYKKAYRIANAEKIVEQSRSWRIRNAARHHWLKAKARARKKGLEFTLTVDWVAERLTSGHCEISGLPFVIGMGRTGNLEPQTPSIDRKDASKGYTPENCRVIAWALNLAFSTWGEERAIEIWKVFLARGGSRSWLV